MPENRCRIGLVRLRGSFEVSLLILALAATLPGAQFVYAVGAGFAPSNRPNILGGYLTDQVTALAVDQQESVYIAGSTYSPDFPADATVSEHTGYTREYLFVAKLSPDASQFVYVTVLPDQVATALALDRDGNAYVASTALLGPFVRATSVLKLDPSGSRILYTANVPATVNVLAVDSAGSVYVAGAVGTTKAATSAFVGKLNPDGTSLLYSTVLGPSDYHGAASVAVDSAGSAYVTGSTNSPAFPTTTGAFQVQLPPAPGYSAFLAKLDPSGTKLLYSTFLTGNSSTGGIGVAVDADGNAYVAGNGSRVDIPVPGGTSQTFGSNQESAGFVVKMNPAGTALAYASVFGGQAVSAIAVDVQLNAHITGTTFGGLPVFRPFQPSFYPVMLPFWTASGTNTYGYTVASDVCCGARQFRLKACLFHLSQRIPE